MEETPQHITGYCPSQAHFLDYSYLESPTSPVDSSEEDESRQYSAQIKTPIESSDEEEYTPYVPQPTTPTEPFPNIRDDVLKNSMLRLLTALQKTAHYSSIPNSITQPLSPEAAQCLDALDYAPIINGATECLEKAEERLNKLDELEGFLDAMKIGRRELKGDAMRLTRRMRLLRLVVEMAAFHKGLPRPKWTYGRFPRMDTDSE